jgi:hypothetical protein
MYKLLSFRMDNSSGITFTPASLGKLLLAVLSELLGQHVLLNVNLLHFTKALIRTQHLFGLRGFGVDAWNGAHCW